MEYSDIRQIAKFCKELDSEPDFRQVVEMWGESDFEVDGVRFINDDDIDDIMQEELSSDLYILGCFSNWVLADVLDLSLDSVDNLQKSGNFEALGMLVVEKGALAGLQEELVRHDGYGHHFNSYDFGEEEVEIAGEFYHVFDNRN